MVFNSGWSDLADQAHTCVVGKFPDTAMLAMQVGFCIGQRCAGLGGWGLMLLIPECGYVHH